ncbi:MAG: hypothetical protein V1900_03465 [Candidatus Aenigmatarchaeota archaeon]
MKAIKRIRGFLTREDIALLEEASQRKLKHPKSVVRRYSCNSCNYNFFYKSVKCPVCGGMVDEKVQSNAKV